MSKTRPIEQGPGLLDRPRDTRLLYVIHELAGHTVVVQERTTGVEQILPLVGYYVNAASLVPGGAVLQVESVNAPTPDSILLWRSGALTEVGFGDSLAVADEFAIFKHSSQVLRLDTSSGVVETVKSSFTSVPSAAIAADGTVVYSEGYLEYQLFRDRAGNRR